VSRNRHRERFWVHSDPEAPAVSANGKCVKCGRRWRDAFLCRRTPDPDDLRDEGGCTEKLERRLASIPGLADDLELAQARQGASGARNGSASTETPLPFDGRATEAAMQLRVELVALVRELEADPGRHPANTLQAMGRWLLTRVEVIRQRPDADAILDSATATVRHVEWVVDRRADRWYAGPCRALCAAAKAPRTVGSLRIVKGDVTGERTCIADLYASPGARPVTCDMCGLAHSASARTAWLLSYSYDLLETATTISRAVEAFDGRPVTPERIRKWAERGRIVAKGERPVGGRVLPTYRVGDVIDLLNAEAAEAERRSMRRAKTAVLAS
jgi:hypothetical protein